MKLTIKNQTEENLEEYENMFQDFFTFAQNKLKFKEEVSLFFVSDPENGEDPLGLTAYYDPDNFNIILYIDGRHIKDLMRSFSHELIHHDQNGRGEFDEQTETFDGYAQEDPHMRQMEMQAYLHGNMNFRDWEDAYKKSRDVLKEWIVEKANRAIVILSEGIK